MAPVDTQSIWKSSARLADGREIIYFDEAPGSGRAQVPDTRPLGPRTPGPALPHGRRGVGHPVGSAGRGVGGHRRRPPGPDLPAAGRPVPARPVQAGAPHRDPGRQLRRGGVREPVPLAGRAAGPVRGGLLHLCSRLVVRRAAAAAGADRARGLGGPDRGAERAARDQAGVLLREPRRGDRRHAAPPARADLRVPVRGAAAGADGGAGRLVRTATTAGTCSTTWWRRRWRPAYGS